MIKKNPRGESDPKVLQKRAECEHNAVQALNRAQAMLLSLWSLLEIQLTFWLKVKLWALSKHEKAKFFSTAIKYYCFWVVFVLTLRLKNKYISLNLSIKYFCIWQNEMQIFTLLALEDANVLIMLNTNAICQIISEKQFWVGIYYWDLSNTPYPLHYCCCYCCYYCYCWYCCCYCCYCGWCYCCYCCCLYATDNQGLKISVFILQFKYAPHGGYT